MRDVAGYGLHLVFAALTGAALLFLFFPSAPQQTSLAMLAACMAGSLLPDLDHKKSAATRAVDFAAFLSAIALSLVAFLVSGSIQAAAVLFVSLALAWLIFWHFFRPAHRGILHSIAVAVFLAIAVFFAARSPELALFSFAGYLSHLALDAVMKLK